VCALMDRPVLDACCGSRMFWFDKEDPRAVFVDNRRENHTLPDVSSSGLAEIESGMRCAPCRLGVALDLADRAIRVCRRELADVP
jgi:hypothetical protein